MSIATDQLPSVFQLSVQTTGTRPADGPEMASTRMVLSHGSRLV
ncbi:hypothetical protein [Halorussus ruber]|nr:hypothetical protein [Halorussus ruber]